MPLVIGELVANVEIDRPAPSGAAPDVASGARDEEKRRMLAVAAERFDRERRIEQRDPDRLGST